MSLGTRFKELPIGLFTLMVVSLFVSLPANAQEFPTFDIRGRLHLDATIHNEDNVNQFSDGFNNRRTRIGVDGQLSEHWDGRIEIDVSEEDLGAEDVRLRRSLASGGRLWLGQFEVPQGLNNMTSSNDISFIERSSISNIGTIGKRLGVAYEYALKPVWFKAMMFGRALGDENEGVGGEEKDMPLGIAARGVYTIPFPASRLHLGVSTSYEDLQEETPISFSDRPEARDSNGGEIRLIDTGEIADARKIYRYGLESAYLRGPVSLEAEYMQVEVNRSGTPDPDFAGWHVQGTYVLTGEQRGYSGGSFGGVTPEGPGGAWEIGARYSHMDLNDDEAGIMGGEQSNVTLGLNHYATSNLRFMGNVVFVDVKDSQAVSALTGGEHVDDSPTIVAVRAQYHF